MNEATQPAHLVFADLQRQAQAAQAPIKGTGVYVSQVIFPDGRHAYLNQAGGYITYEPKDGYSQLRPSTQAEIKVVQALVK